MSSSVSALAETGGGIANTRAQEKVSDINVMVAGRGGDGSLTIITLLSRLLSHSIR